MASLPGVDGHGAFERSFDFSEFPNLQEVAFAVGWMDGSLAWIPRALSTIKPATSPRLSVIQLNFSRPIIAIRSVDALITDTSDDLRWVADEIARIKGEFEGAVDLAVHWDSSFRVVLDALNVRFLLLANKRRLGIFFILIHSLQILQP